VFGQLKVTTTLKLSKLQTLDEADSARRGGFFRSAALATVYKRPPPVS